MAEFYFPPEWLAAAGPPPDVDPDRIEGLQNGFLAATHEALHTAPDAFYLEHRRCGELESRGVEDDRVWITCTCGAVIVQALEPVP